MHLTSQDLHSMGLPFHADETESEAPVGPSAGSSARVFDEEGRPLFLEGPGGITVLASRMPDGSLVPFGAAPAALEMEPGERAHYRAIERHKRRGAESRFSRNAAVANLSRGEMSVAATSGAAAMLDLPRVASLAARRLVAWPWFDRLFLALIAVAVILLAIENPDTDPNSTLGRFLAAAEVVFTVVFAIEILTKMLAFGVRCNRPGTYFRSPLNILDVVVVAADIVSFTGVLGTTNLAALRALRALRPLRTVERLPGLRRLVTSLVRSVGNLAHLCCLMLIFFALAGLVAMEVFGGSLSNRCFSLSDGSLDDGQERACGGMYSCDSGTFCGSDRVAPDMGVTTFTNIGWAGINLLFAVTLEGWTPLMYRSQDAVGQWAWVFWVAVVAVGSFILFNLALAVVTTNRAGNRKTSLRVGGEPVGRPGNPSR
ncbi:hypothetical protein FNF27_04102 [Cafeteria roenbergensis]|uniref:Ion transport domain-containing protein n=1 Tax=Cafeteria roenbergensis TaxID=33653 RepID=A0A5A8E9T7_CAFRO|nr:hypothetical protein FNF27_04102 [Cafeteria roenbergensis]